MLLRVQPLQVPADPADPVNENFLNRVVARHAVGDLRADGQHLEHALRQVGLGEQLGEHAASRAASALAGLTTIGAPTASAGATLCATRFTGKLNGVMPRTGPMREPADQPDARTERRLGVQPHELAVAVRGSPRRPTGTSRPRGWPRPSPTSAACRPRAAISSAYSSIVSASRARCDERLGAHVDGQVLRLLERRRRRPPTASSTSAAVGTPTSATTLSSYGLRDLERALARPPLAVHEERLVSIEGSPFRALSVPLVERRPSRA